MSEPSVTKHQRNKTAEDRLAKQYREIGIKAVAAAVKSRNKDVAEAITRGRMPVSTKRNRENE